jgi:16S rRNA (guanine966-N2)-methyltransferase
MLTSRLGSFEGLQVADLFAGSGALGLEALSRGAAHCLFVDNEREAVAAIKRNVAALGGVPRADVRAQGVEHAPPPPRPCDLVFLDPPYSTGLAAAALQRVCTPPWVARGGIVSIETDGEPLSDPGGFTREAERRFGKAFITLFRRA